MQYLHQYQAMTLVPFEGVLSKGNASVKGNVKGKGNHARGNATGRCAGFLQTQVQVITTKY